MRHQVTTHGAARVVRAVFLLGLAAACLSPAPGRAELLEVAPIADTLPFFDGRAWRDPRPDDEFPPLRVLLSRHRYWAQDGHLDVVVQLAPPAGGVVSGELRGRILDAAGAELSSFTIATLPGAALIAYPAIPDALLAGGTAELELTWQRDGINVAMVRQPFRVERFAAAAPPAGRVRLAIANESGARIDNLPVTVGVPFPRGVLASTDHLRLVDGDGAEVPLQALETARWSKFGSVKWVLCDFTVGLDGGPRELFLEYGEEMSSGGGEPLLQAPGPGGFPAVESGRLRFANGLWFDAQGDGQFVQVLGADALSGAFVEHEDGRLYRPDPATPFVVEETGPVKTVLRREGWYVEAATARRFCQYITRYVIHRNSPLVRVFHTWVFTGDGNRDRIRNMGWRFDLAGEGSNGAFLTAFDADAWMPGESLLQYDYEHFDLVANREMVEFPGGRAPGAARVEINGVRLYFGAKDFWQNYPSELEVADGAFWFHNWPRHNRPARYTFDKELIVERDGPAASSSSAARYALEAPDRLTHSEWVLNVIQSRHAHEGEVLDFRLPEVYNEEPIWSAINGGAAYWDRGDVETLNAQGVSRTEEFWLLLVDPATDMHANTAAVLQGLNDETLRAVVDPAWVAASGGLYEIHPRDPERFPREEAIYEEVALSPGRVAERLGIYGMWIYGDVPSWSPRLETKDPELYRAFARQHLGWPYPWTPFARSGDSRLFKWAEASTRNVLDLGWCLFADAEVDQRVGPDRYRRKGILLPGPIPWDNGSGKVPVTRSLLTRVDYLLDAWYLTGYRRAMDQVRTWMDLARVQEDLDSRGAYLTFGRQSNAPLKAYVEAWEATFDPWFLVAAHGLSQGHLHGRTSEHADGRYGGRQWDTGDREFLRFTGDPEFREFYLNRHAARAVSERVWSNWNRRRPIIPAKVFAWQLTGDDYYLRRTAYDVEDTVYRAGDWNPYAHGMRTEPRKEWVQGVWDGNSFGRAYRFFTATHLRWFPHALWALAQADERPAPIYTTYNALLPDRAPAEPRQRLTLAMKKAVGQPLTVYLSLGTDRHLGALPAAPAGFAMEYTLSAPDGSPRFEGVWTNPETLEMEASAPAGVCRLELHTDRGAGHVFGLPATEVGTPEVILPGPGEATPCVGWRSLWFRVPEGTERFSVLASGPSATIVAPDGLVVWRATDANPDAERVVPVPPEQAGRLWRINVPGHIRLSADIPPVYAVEPDRWFLP